VTRYIGTALICVVGNRAILSPLRFQITAFTRLWKAFALLITRPQSQGYCQWSVESRCRRLDSQGYSEKGPLPRRGNPPVNSRSHPIRSVTRRPYFHTSECSRRKTQLPAEL